jgi:hypothetical protein
VSDGRWFAAGVGLVADAAELDGGAASTGIGRLGRRGGSGSGGCGCGLGDLVGLRAQQLGPDEHERPRSGTTGAGAGIWRARLLDQAHNRTWGPAQTMVAPSWRTWSATRPSSGLVCV